ncbi:MAG: 6-phosphofructokinase [Christensenellales bacterium]|jgi:6-phosphofructokinase 1|nr:6-phosphofructokinase [Clostridiales bacterium]
MAKIAVLTSGGDAPGMNATIRAVVRSGSFAGHEIYGIERGFDGLLNRQIKRMDSRSVSDIIQRGGTILKTARSEEFNTEAGVKKAAEILKAFKIDGLIVIGGDGSFKGARDLVNLGGISCVGIPCTIDNDLSYTDYTIGFDTATNTVVSAINNIRDTMTSHDRACIIEVMGRKCGDIALYAGIASGAESIVVPELPFDLKTITDKMRTNNIKGKASDIIVLAEGVCSCADLKIMIQEEIDIVIRTVKLGYIQRGGSPSMADRVLGARLAERAVALFDNGYKGGHCVGIKDNKIIALSIDEALSAPCKFNKELYAIANKLSF